MNPDNAITLKTDESNTDDPLAELKLSTEQRRMVEANSAKMEKFEKLLDENPAPELTLEGLKNISQVAEYYPNLSLEHHKRIVEFAKNFKTIKIDKNLNKTAVDVLGATCLEIASSKIADEILENLEKGNYLWSVQAGDGIDNDNDALNDIEDPGVIDSNGQPRIFKYDEHRVSSTDDTFDKPRGGRENKKKNCKPTLAKKTN